MRHRLFWSYDVETWPATPPGKILLATDLSGRSDRALDRAVQLAGEWNAALHVIHVLGDPSATPDQRGLPSRHWPPDMAAVVERQIRDDISGPCPELHVHVEDGAVLPSILEAVRRERPDLVIVAGNSPQPFSSLEKTIDELFRRCPVSVLVVKRRPHGAYHEILVGEDFTDEARHGFEVAVRLFPEAAFTLMHAHDVAYASLYLNTKLSEDFSEMERATIRESLEKASIPDAARARVTTLIERGAPEAMLSNYVRERGADLTVIGTYERGRLFHVVVGGQGPRIVQAVPSDVLMVRADRADRAVERAISGD